MAAHKLNGWTDNIPQIRILSSVLQQQSNKVLSIYVEI